MTPVQREARTFLSQFHHRPFTVSDLEKALQAQGFSLVEYSRVSNGKEVTTLLTSLRLFDYAARQSAFTYQDPHLRIVFMQENLSQQEQMILLSHELGHILCRHLERDGIPFREIDFPRYGKPSAAMVQEYLDGNLAQDDLNGVATLSIDYR